jgi:hypothetical protein
MFLHLYLQANGGDDEVDFVDGRIPSVLLTTVVTVPNTVDRVIVDLTVGTNVRLEPVP